MNRNSIRRWSWLGAAAALLQLAGCASFEFTRAAPQSEGPITLKLSGEQLSGMNDLPIGVYRVPDSHVIISGHQRGQAAGMLFGLIGLAVVHAANAGSGADAVKEAEAVLKINLDAPITAGMRDIAAAKMFSRQFTLEDRQGGTRLQVTPGLVLSFVTDTTVRPYLVLKTEMTGADGKTWKGRYIASTSTPRPLSGTDGWLSDNGAPLQRAVADDIRIALRTLATDVTQPYVRDENKLTMLQGQFPHVKQRLQTVGFMLDENDRYVTFIPKLGDVIVFAGVNIFDKPSVVYRAALKDDSVFKLLEATAPAK